MSEIINLNKRRKAKAKISKEKTAEANRHKFGRTKEEKEAEKLKKDFQNQYLDGHKLEKDE